MLNLWKEFLGMTDTSEASVGVFEIKDSCPVVRFVFFEFACCAGRDARYVQIMLHGQVKGILHHKSVSVGDILVKTRLLLRQSGAHEGILCLV